MLPMNLNHKEEIAMKKEYVSPKMDLVKIKINDRLLDSSDVPESMLPDFQDSMQDNDNFTVPLDW